MHADERDYLSESLRAPLEAAFGEESLLVGVLVLAKSADELQSIGYRLVAEARAKRAEERG